MEVRQRNLLRRIECALIKAQTLVVWGQENPFGDVPEAKEDGRGYSGHQLELYSGAVTGRSTSRQQPAEPPSSWQGISQRERQLSEKFTPNMLLRNGADLSIGAGFRDFSKEYSHRLTKGVLVKKSTSADGADSGLGTAIRDAVRGEAEVVRLPERTTGRS